MTPDQMDKVVGVVSVIVFILYLAIVFGGVL
jgi:hypothetical protein